MTIHLLKLCVGCSSIDELKDWIEDQRLLMTRLGREFEQLHTTRHYPKQAESIIGRGSLYWVIKREIAARQPIREIRQFFDENGTSRCHLVLDTVVTPVEPRPFRPFQGWRYLSAHDAPPDLGVHNHSIGSMPQAMRRELLMLGLI